MASVATPVTPAPSTPLRKKPARRRVLRAALRTASVPSVPNETSLAASTSLRLVDAAFL